MPTVRIPLVGSFSQRGIAGNAALVLNQDQRFLNCQFEVVTNTVTGKSTVYLSKRPGWGVDSLVSSGIASTGLIKPQSFNATLSAFGETNSAVYVGTINVGNTTGRALHFTETLISNSSYVLMKCSDGTGWYYAEGAKDTLTYTGDTISGNFLVTTVALMTGVYSGQLLTGGQMGAGARVTSVNFATSTFGMSVAASATSTGAVITKEPIAKILNANFVSTGTYISAFAATDGYHVYATDDGYLNNSDLNSIIAYSANGRIAVQQSPDPPVAVAVQKETVVVFGLASNQKFQNVGNASGSPFQVVKPSVEHLGALDQRSVTQIDDDVYYVSTPYEGDIGVYRMRGLNSTRVSTPVVDRILGTVNPNGAIYASSFKLGGYTYAAFVVSLASDGPSSMLLLESGDFLLLENADNILTEDTPAQSASFVRMLVYNVGLNIWSEWDCDESTFIDGVSIGSANQLVATSRFVTGGKVYTINPASDGQLYQDDGSSYSMQVRTSRIDFGSPNIKFLNKVRFIGDTQSAGTSTLEISDDDYGSWRTLGTFDHTKQAPQITRCGSFRAGAAFRLTHSYNGPFRGEALEFDVTIGAS